MAVTDLVTGFSRGVSLCGLSNATFVAISRRRLIHYTAAGAELSSVVLPADAGTVRPHPDGVSVLVTMPARGVAHVTLGSVPSVTPVASIFGARG